MTWKLPVRSCVPVCGNHGGSHLGERWKPGWCRRADVDHGRRCAMYRPSTVVLRYCDAGAEADGARGLGPEGVGLPMIVTSSWLVP